MPHRASDTGSCNETPLYESAKVYEVVLHVTIHSVMSIHNCKAKHIPYQIPMLFSKQSLIGHVVK